MYIFIDIVILELLHTTQLLPSNYPRPSVDVIQVKEKQVEIELRSAWL